MAPSPDHTSIKYSPGLRDVEPRSQWLSITTATRPPITLRSMLGCSVLHNTAGSAVLLAVLWFAGRTLPTPSVRSHSYIRLSLASLALVAHSVRALLHRIRSSYQIRSHYSPAYPPSQPRLQSAYSLRDRRPHSCHRPRSSLCIKEGAFDTRKLVGCGGAQPSDDEWLMNRCPGREESDGARG